MNKLAEYRELTAAEVYQQLASNNKLHLLSNLYVSGYITRSTFRAVRRIQEAVHDNNSIQTGGVPNKISD